MPVDAGKCGVERISKQDMRYCQRNWKSMGVHSLSLIATNWGCTVEA